MPFGLFTSSNGHDFSLAQLATSQTAQACVACFLAPEGGMPVPGTWMDVYRLAYDRSRASLGPSRIQAMLEPCWN
jgi:hypothetical protein